MWPHKRAPDEDAVRAYFNFTDRGITPRIKNTDLDELLFNHKHMPVLYEMWKKDMGMGLLFLYEFDDERPALRELATKAWIERDITEENIFYKIYK